MAPQTTTPLAATILGTIGTVFWCIQLLPQIWANYRQKKTDGLPGLMMFLWAISAVPFGVYAIVQNFNLPVQIQPQIFCMLSLVSWAQILIYNNDWPTWKATGLALAIGGLFGGVEVVLILTLRGPFERGTAWPILLIGVCAAILLAAGLLPPYFELWKRKGRVIGINFIFLTVDFLGAFFSLMAVIAQETFDPLGSVLFIVCITLEIGIFFSHAIWLLRTRHLRKQAKDEGKDFDELPAAEPYHPALVRVGSIAASRNLEDGQLNAFSRRSSMVSVMASRHGSVAASRRGSVATYGPPRKLSTAEGTDRRQSNASNVNETITPKGKKPNFKIGGMPPTGFERPAFDPHKLSTVPDMSPVVERREFLDGDYGTMRTPASGEPSHGGRVESPGGFVFNAPVWSRDNGL